MAGCYSQQNSWFHQQRSSNRMSNDKSSDKKGGLNPDELRELQEIFSLVDKDGGGTISLDELEILMRTLGLRPTQMELEQMMKEIDIHRTGEIGFDDFVSAMSRRVSTSYSIETLRSAFVRFEENPSKPTGHILYENLVEVFTRYGPSQMTVEEAEDFISQLAPQLGKGEFFDYANYLQVLFDS